MKRALLLCTAVAALGAAAPASGATIAYDGSTLVYTAADGEKNDVGPYLESTKDGWVRIPAGYGVTFPSVPDGCDDWRDNGNFVSCPVPGALRFELGDGDDSFSAGSDLPATLPIRVDGGAGVDDLRGWAGPETLLGGPGNDRLSGWKGDDVLDGGAGEDEISGYAGADRLAGGDGNDTLHPDDYQLASADVVDGGAGIDTIQSDYWTGDAPGPYLPLAFTLSGGADDGRPGEADDITGVERLVLSSAAKVTGTDGADYVKLHQVGGDGELTGLGGADELRGGDGADRIDGGTGDDVLDGGFGDDAITGGPGRDRISADLAGGDCGPMWCKLPYGNDTVDARDGEVDSIDCGAGADTVKADADDVVAPSCETVERAAAQGGASGGPTTPAGGGKAPVNAPVKLRVLRGAKLTAALRSGLTVQVAGMRKGAKATARSGGRIVARGTAKRPGRVTLKFTGAARRSLGRKRSVQLAIAAGAVRGTLVLRR